jgi:hypothetical protein
MSDSDIIPFGAAIAGDILSAFSIPGGDTLVSGASNSLRPAYRDGA